MPKAQRAVMPASRPPAGPRSRGNVIHLEAAGLPNTGDPKADQQAERALGDLVPYDPSLETPDEGGAPTDA